MIIYTNEEINVLMEDMDDVNVSYDELIFSLQGMFKKYKYHFFECDVQNSKTVHYDNMDFYIQDKPHSLNKQKLITSIPYHHYYVKRKIMKVNISDTICWIKEIDNDRFTQNYFETVADMYISFDEIRSFIQKKVCVQDK